MAFLTLFSLVTLQRSGAGLSKTLFRLLERGIHHLDRSFTSVPLDHSYWLDQLCIFFVCWGLRLFCPLCTVCLGGLLPLLVVLLGWDESGLSFLTMIFEGCVDVFLIFTLLTLSL